MSRRGNQSSAGAPRVVLAQNLAQSNRPADIGKNSKKEKQPTGKTKEEESSPAEQTLKAARERLVDDQPIKAELRETVVIGDRKFTATGRYLQGKNLKLRLDFTVNLGNRENALSGSLLEVCDGDVLFTRHKIGKDVHITRRDVAQILRAAKASGAIPHNVLVAELGLGGLPALLASLEQTMTFDSLKQEQIDGKPFTVIEGTWNKEFLDRLKGPDADESTPLPSHVPDLVRIYFDENHFPHRILYLKRRPTRKIHRPMVTLDFTKIVLRASIDEEEFDFVPPKGEIPMDITNTYIQRLIKPAATPSRPESRSKQPEK